MYATPVVQAATPAHWPVPLVGLLPALELVLVLVGLELEGLEPLTGHESALTCAIQLAAASGNSQTITPASHPCDFACSTQVASVAGAMYPLDASDVVAGFPMTSLSRDTPEAAIWKRAEFGQVEEEVVRRPEHVVYSEVPSEGVTIYI